MPTRWLNRRLIVRATIFLLLGAVVNVLVAWGCACWSPSPPYERTRRAETAWSAPVPDDWPPLGRQSVDRGFGLTEHHAFGDAPRDSNQSWDRSHQWVCQVGLPFRSLSIHRNRVESDLGMYWILAAEPPKNWRGGLSIPDCANGIRQIRYGRWLPTQIIWSGFTANTIFYAALLFGMVAMPHTLRTRWRIKCVQCPACGYPIGTSPVCTECGAPLPDRATCED